MKILLDHIVHRIFEIYKRLDTVESVQIKENINYFEMLYK
jgi:hypothetical protein